MQHRMLRLPLGDWHVVGMGQVFSVVTTGGPDNGEGGEVRRTEWYLTQRRETPPLRQGFVSCGTAADRDTLMFMDQQVVY